LKSVDDELQIADIQKPFRICEETQFFL